MKQTIHPSLRSPSWGAIGLTVALSWLGGCGGGGDSRDALTPAAKADSAQVSSGSMNKLATLAQGATLNTAELQAAEQQAQAAEAAGSPTPLDELQPGTIASKRDYRSGEVARKALAVRIPAYRFYNTSTGAHFYTTSETEKATVQAKLSPPFSFDGPAFNVAGAFSAGLSSVHRFFNTKTGVHFYTISEAERANVVATLPPFTYEGVAYYASQVAGAGLKPLYRFYVPAKGFHFYTASETEKASILANLSATYTFEGIGYYVLDTGWQSQEKLPHTGVTTSQCFQAGSDTLVACSASGATALNPQQDGHRASINAMSYSEVPNPSGGTYARTSCVQDNVTGLMWEGKEASGARAGSNRITNLGNGAANDTSAYVTAVNNNNLCGHNDWRLPTRLELLTIVDHGRFNPSIKMDWFPNTDTTYYRYWTSQAVNPDSAGAWLVSFNAGFSNHDARSNGNAVRLVRGNTFSGPRYSFTTVAYGSDGANNLVNDAWTGLQWRRCEQGRVWSGSVCTGTETFFTHESALAFARDQSGWRLPNVNELASLTDLSVASGASIDAAAFPGASANFLWSSSPYVGLPGLAWGVLFVDGLVYYGYGRGNSFAVRLVRASQ